MTIRCPNMFFTIKEYIQATSIMVEDWIGPITIIALYCPPKHSIKKEQLISSEH